MPKFTNPVLSLFLLIILYLGQDVYGQTNGRLENEILVFILPDSLEISPLEKTSVNLGKATIKSENLFKALEEVKAQGIARAFPDWEDAPKIAISEDGEQIKAPDFHRIFVLYFINNDDADRAIGILQRQPSVLYAEKHTQNAVLDNDPMYLNGTQWHLDNNGGNGGTVGADVNAEGAWQIFTGSSALSVGIFDSGVEISHTEFQNKASGDPASGDGHGTGVAGIVAARANNGFLGRGLDWEAQILSKRIFAPGYQGDAVVSQKISEAVSSGSQIFNHSWSGTTQSNTLAMAFAYAYKMNRVSIATTGNTGQQELRFPGGYSNVMAIGNTTNTDIRQANSTFGDHIDVVAPGTNIFTTNLNNGGQINTGTSFAAPSVSGLASLIKGYRTQLTNDDIRLVIQLSADQVPLMGGQDFHIQYGHGRINAGRALEMLRDNDLQHLSTSGGTVNNVTGTFTVQMLSAHPNLASGTYLAKRHEVRKQVTVPTSFCNIVSIWGRGVGSNGWAMRNPNFGEGFTEVVPGTLTSNGATLRTYVYELWTTSGQSLGFYPATPSNAVLAYSVFGQNPNVSGLDVMCSASSYSLQGVPLSGISANWSVTPTNLFVTASGTGTTANLVPASSSSSGQATLTFNLSGTCGNIQRTKLIQVGRINSAQATLSGTAAVCPGNQYTYQANVPGGHKPGYVYQWTFPSNWSVQNQSANSITLYVPTYNPAYGTVQFRVNNGCGFSEYTGITVFPGYSCSSGFLDVNLFPNPVSNELNIVMLGESGNKIQKNDSMDQDLEISLYDLKGYQVFKIKTRETEITIDVSKLKSGFYYLHILHKEGLIRRQIRVER